MCRRRQLELQKATHSRCSSTPAPTCCSQQCCPEHNGLPCPVEQAMYLAALADQTPFSCAWSMAAFVESCRLLNAKFVLHVGHIDVCLQGLCSDCLQLGATLLNICLQGMSPEEINEYMAKHGNVQPAS